jgi:GT2 family glycosyltransferase
MNNICFSVIIVAYKNISILIDCIKSIYKNNDINDSLEVIIIDNSPKESVVASIKEKFKEIIYIYNSENGFGKANNIGASLARGDYLLFLNPDTILIEPIFSFAVNCFESDSKLGLFGVKLLKADFKPTMSFFWMDRWGIWYNQLIKIYNRLNIYVDGKMFIAGANLFIKKDIFFKCEKFDENIFMYCEEADLIKRIQLCGFKTAFFHHKRIIHLHGKCTEDSEFAFRKRMESNKYYCQKYKLNFNKRIKKEINYTKLKYFVYLMMGDSRAILFKKNLNIMYDLINNHSCPK